MDSGLTFACDFGTDFTGKAAIEERRDKGANSRLLLFRLDDPNALVFGGEPILRDGEIVGRLTSASYGWSVGGAIGMGYVTRPEGVGLKELAGAEYSIKVEGRSVPAQAQPAGAIRPGQQSDAKLTCAG